MLRKTNCTFLVFHGLMLILIGLCLVLAIDSLFFQQLLNTITSENGIVAIAVFFIFLMTSSFAMIIIFNHQFEKVFTSARRHFVSLIAISFYIFAMQEIKWSQLLVQEAPSSNQVDTLEVATGANTLIHQETVFYLIHLAIFVGFIAIPLVIYFLPDRIKQTSKMKGKIVIYLPSLHNILMFSYGCLLFTLMNPAYYINFYLLGLEVIVMLLLLLVKKENLTASNLGHLLLFGTSLVIMMVFEGHIPMKENYHQLWKFIAGYAFFYWLYNWTVSLKNKAKVVI